MESLKEEIWIELSKILEEGVKPALGCTEPVAVGLAVSKAFQVIQGNVKKIKVTLSPNIFKNGMRVGIPGTHEKGLVFATALGITCGDPQLELEVFQRVNSKAISEADELIKRECIDITIEYHKGSFYIEAEVITDKGNGLCVIKDSHTNIVLVKANERILFSKDNRKNSEKENRETILKGLPLKEIQDFVENVPLSQIEFLLEGAKMNLEIAQVGLENRPGAGIGAALNKLALNHKIKMDMPNRARILTSAACDARMAGIKMPVMTTSGSGNQGLTAIIPLTVVCKYLQVEDEKLARALAFSHLTTAYIKTFIGKLSPICGCAVAAGIGACAAITWILGGNSQQIGGAIKNMAGSLVGMICDGAKGGCAFKISTAAAESIIQAELAMENVFIDDLDGIISSEVEKTIKNLGKFCTYGMKDADRVMIEIMLENK